MRSEPEMQRRLSAIVCADVAGYSRLMGVDEAGTLTALKGHGISGAFRIFPALRFVMTMSRRTSPGS